MFFCCFLLNFHYRGLLKRGVADPVAARSMDDVERFLPLPTSRARRSGVGVYDMRRADPNESFDLESLLGPLALWNMPEVGSRLLA